MMISNLQINSLLKIYNKAGGHSNNLGKAEGKNGTLNNRVTDQTQVSEEAKSFQVAMKATQSAPEVREGTVTELREAIRTGNYSVKGEDIAEKMLARVLVDKLV